MTFEWTVSLGDLLTAGITVAVIVGFYVLSFGKARRKIDHLEIEVELLKGAIEQLRLLLIKLEGAARHG